MTFAAAKYALAFEPRPNKDVSQTEFAERLSICGQCRARQLGNCGLTKKLVTVEARQKNKRCPLAKWPRDLDTPNAPFLAPYRPVENLAVVACHFNPCHYQRPVEHFWRFASGLWGHADLFTVELVFDDDNPDLDAVSNRWEIRGRRDRHLLWQKERLINLAVSKLPAQYDAVAWIDADALFLRDDWVSQTKRLLERLHFVQLYDTLCDLHADRRLALREKSSAGYEWQRRSGLHNDTKRCYPGLAWAGRRETIDRHGLVDCHPTGGADSFFLYGLTGELPPRLGRLITGPWRNEIRRWAVEMLADVWFAWGHLPGTMLHLYHGSHANRKYSQRYAYLSDYGFDPSTDLETDHKTGLLQWSRFARWTKPKMVELVAAYFIERREDD